MQRLEFETLQELQQHLQAGKSVDHAVFHALDLRPLREELLAAKPRRPILLGCRVDDPTLDAMEHPVVFPPLDDLPFRAYRGDLYTPEELLGGYKIGDPEGHAKTLDGRCFRHYQQTHQAHAADAYVTLARRLHDHSITDALQELIEGRNVVAIMGGHSMPRGTELYLQIARLARDLTRRGLLVTSGGGPGAMEATHLGAWFAERDDEELQQANAMLAAAPQYQPITQWMDAAFRVCECFPLTSSSACESLGIPTWLYGHEPPTCFATKIAKYFANSVREEGLLAIANCGVIFTPGNEGTIQEVFQDAAQNRYKTFEHASPMVFFGRDYWTNQKPIYPALKTISANRDYNTLITITDDLGAIVQTVTDFAHTLAKHRSLSDR
ncbi:hypothetical protein FYK55_03095 [Roseiconus nitratireducens]|uniref:Rossmann-fold nucleotide-binding protein n=1 Tax=Roseiconus nitratireducens TaxID=2605748 RepID=A0A5M6DKP9_9BACT|nr:hypothetical protein [Roseiconus nitratireducens]KAA5545915.1 hypothetical protein FYK55_03095 [Roseiconus nitratireducens]